MHHLHEDGFTLVELLVVIVIIGILAAIAIPTFLTQRDRGYYAAVISDVRNAVLEVEALYVENSGRYPPDQATYESQTDFSPSRGVTLTYDANSLQDEFCVEGQHADLDPALDVASYVGRRGVELYRACPAFTNP